MLRFRLLLLAGLFLLPALSGARGKNDVRVLTFNIRIENPDDDINSWANRRKAATDFIKASRADLVGLQEVALSQLQDLQAALTDYICIGGLDPSFPTDGRNSPLFFRKASFNVLKSGVFWLSLTPDQSSLGWDAAYRRVCSWALLRHQSSGKIILFANTHLDHKGAKAQAEGVKLLKQRLADELPSGAALVLTGDFNVEDNSPAYALACEHILPLADAWKTAKNAKGPRITYHGFGKIPEADCTKIDFIFVRPTTRVLRAKVVQSSLGKGLFLSDHHPYWADLRLP